MKRFILGCALVAAISTPALAQWDSGGGTGDTIADMTTISDTTWGAGEANHVWTFDTTGTNPVMTTSDSTIAFTGKVTARELQSAAVLGSELTTNGTFTTDLTGWSGTNWAAESNKARHTAGSTAALTQNITVTTGETYSVSLVVADRTVGSVSVTVGAATVYYYGTLTTMTGNTTYTESFVAADTGAVALNITPTTDFDGTVDTVSIKNVTLGSSGIAFAITDSSGNSTTEFRSTADSYNNTYIGEDAGRSSALATQNICIGAGAGYSIINGGLNTFVGMSSGYNTTGGQSNAFYGQTSGQANTEGSYNAFFGQAAGLSNTTGQANTLIGEVAGYLITTGDYNNALGQGALASLTTGSSNVAIGTTAARYLTDGATAAEQMTNSVYIGRSSRPLATDETNAVVIGGVTALGKGSNTTVIGNSATTDAYIYGGLQANRKVESSTGGTLTINAITIATAGSADYDIPDNCDSATGAWVEIYVRDVSEVVSITTLDTGDLFVYKGIATLAANDELDSPGAAGDSILLVCLEANKWYMMRADGSWVDGGAAD